MQLLKEMNYTNMCTLEKPKGYNNEAIAMEKNSKSFVLAWTSWSRDICVSSDYSYTLISNVFQSSHATIIT
jgi:hypothetical protein